MIVPDAPPAISETTCWFSAAPSTEEVQAVMLDTAVFEPIQFCTKLRCSGSVNVRSESIVADVFVTTD